MKQICYQKVYLYPKTPIRIRLHEKKIYNLKWLLMLQQFIE